MLIYEAHVKGLTKLNHHVKEENRGKFLGVSDPWMIQHYKRLGVTHVELMPVFDSRGTYWGYDPVSWFDLNPEYGTIAEFKLMLKELHKAGIKLILDVVYNHTYRTQPGVKYYDWNVTGCWNTVDVKSTLELILDSMEYWMISVGIDGMRFDLANVMGREGGNFNPNAEFFIRSKRYSNLGKLLIAEPWDCSEYSLGRFPDNWLEWNGEFRDTVRKGHIYHGSQLPDHRAVNFITCHDGFTLQDFVSYNEKHNHANGEDNRDGCDRNYSWNHGVEGPSDDPKVISNRNQHKDWLIRQLMTSGAIAKLMLAGDEVDNTQFGNNNAYNQDNEVSWIKWDDAKINYYRFRS